MKNTIREIFESIMCMCAEGPDVFGNARVVQSVLKEAEKGFKIVDDLAEIEHLQVHSVKEAEGGWDVMMGPEGCDSWLTVRRDDFGEPPEVGDIVEVLVPKVVSILTKCRTCGGSGWTFFPEDADNPEKKCMDCAGSGWICRERRKYD